MEALEALDEAVIKTALEDSQRDEIATIRQRLENLSNYYGEFGEAHDAKATSLNVGINSQISWFMKRAVDEMEELIRMETKVISKT